MAWCLIKYRNNFTPFYLYIIPYDTILYIILSRVQCGDYYKGAHTRGGLWKVNLRVSEAPRQTFVCVINAASGFRLYPRPVTLSPLLEVFLAGKGYEMPVLSRSAGKPLSVWGSHGCVPHSRVAFRVTCRSLGLPANLCVYGALKTGIGLTTGFIGSHTITVFTLHNSLLQLQLFSEDCCSARILTRSWSCTRN
jgi:hypothetical protein